LSFTRLPPERLEERATPPTRSSGRTKNSSDGSKTKTVQPSAETAAMSFWALLASGQICMRKVDGWKIIAEKSIALLIELAA